MIQTYLNDIDAQNEKIKQAKNPLNNRRFRIEGDIGKEMATDRLKDYMLRMRTTSVNSQKYA